MVDVKNKRCVFPGCDTQPIYGKPGYPKQFCATHKQIGMMVKPNPKCWNKTCKEKAIWGRSFKLVHCPAHKQPGETNMVEARCVKCALPSVLDPTGHCEYCNPEAFETGRLAKQNALMDFLDMQGLQGETTDRLVDGGECGKERPDRVYDFGDKMLILECDENQHKDRPCLCEQTRMVNLGQAFGGIRVYFLRWNPDEYKGGNAALSTRYKLVAALIKDIRDGRHPVPETLTACKYLYFDGWKGLAAENWNILS